jgi:hypothetical protein
MMVDSFLVRHSLSFLKTDSTSNEHVCDKCEKSFPRVGNLQRHEKEKHFGGKHQCNSCGKQFVRKHQLEMHFRTIHEEHSDGLMQFECEHCRKCFQDKFSYERHASSSRTCNICDSTFCNLRHLADHKKTGHGAFSCHNCSKSFRDGDKLKKHQNFITCELCFDQICNGQEMRKHMKSHNESHKCSYCGKVMSVERWMDEHIERRTDQCCSICGKTFCYSSDVTFLKTTQHVTER